jgi:alkylhydroperoxidase/carboxymuconolactone decarboxylase family protein YurZ
MNEETKKYILEKFGRMHPVFEHMDKYSPEIVEGFIKIRKATLPSKGVEGAIPEKYKELIVTAVEVATGRGEKGRSHARKAVRLGATPKEVQEAVSLCIWLAGWATWVDGGSEAVKAAEEEEEKVKKGEEFHWTADIKGQENINKFG